MLNAQVETFFHKQTATFSYVVHQVGNASCAIIDSVLDYDPKSGRTSTACADQIIAYVSRNQLRVQWILETHAHADHISAAAYLKERLGGQTGIGAHIVQVQSVFQDILNLGPEFAANASQFDQVFEDGQVFAIGDLPVRALHVPGHTPADVAYCIEGVGVFAGDTLFMPDVGTARCDFPGGDAHALYESIRRILSLGDDTLLYLCHDYPPESRSRQCCVSVKEQREHNIHVRDGISADEFVAMRTERDKTLDMPALIIPSIQINIRAGQYPEPDSNGIRYLKTPLNVL